MSHTAGSKEERRSVTMKPSHLQIVCGHIKKQPVEYSLMEHNQTKENGVDYCIGDSLMENNSINF